MTKAVCSRWRRVRLVAGLCVATGLVACAGLKANDPWVERSAQRNEAVAETWRRSGHPEMGERYATQAENDRAAAAKADCGFLEAVLDTLFFAWLDQPRQASSKR